MNYGFPKSPWAHPNGCPKYFVRDRCLTAPKPHMVDGIYDMDPRRRIRPGLVPMTNEFISTITSGDLTGALLGLYKARNTSMAIKRLREIIAS